MRLYEDFTDEELAAEIAAYRGAIRKADLNDVGVVAGEGRRVEFTRSNVGSARTALRDMLAEWNRRNGRHGGGSILLEIG
jgi:hypothetical protein